MPTGPKIQDHAAIGDGRSVALIARDGCLDWLCWPRFDSPSLFAGLLDARTGGSWSIAPAAEHQVERRYLDETNVLETRFRTDGGLLVLTDFMPAASEEDKRRMLWPEHELVRRVACERGEVGVEVRFDPRPDYGRSRANLRDAGKLGLRIDRGSELFTLLSDVEWTLSAGGGASARFRLKAGEAASFSLLLSAEGPAVLPPRELIPRKLALTVDWWRNWAGRARYDGPYRDPVIRSALALKLLAFAPSGAIVAAPTTSLPERIGGDLNWDYRFCWLRDAAFTARAFFGLGYREEAEAFISWMLHATRLTHPELQVFYDVYGERPPDETELRHLDGYAGSRPVRIGNGAMGQLQLDMYGGLIHAVEYFLREGGDLDREERRFLRGLGEFVCRHWRDPDNGIWEERERRKHYTLSRALCWVALDKLLVMSREGRMSGVPEERFATVRGRIREDIEENFWSPRLGSYKQARDEDDLDAALLLLASHGYEDAASDRMRRTGARVRERLGAGPGLLYRYDKSREVGEGAFTICAFWLVDFLARGGGDLREAREAFDRALPYANDLGLFAEEVEPETGDALGNFPQAFSHVGLINAALSLAERESRS